MENNLNPEATQLLLPAGQNQSDETVNLSQPQIEQQKALAGVIARIRESLDLETIFKTTAIEVRSLLKADRDRGTEFLIEIPIKQLSDFRF